MARVTRKRLAEDGIDRGIAQLASIITDPRKPLVVFVTGAGMSVASGVPAFRGKDGVWDRHVLEWGTRERFLADPATWWAEFWDKTHGPALGKPGIEPNEGHRALGRIMQRHTSCKLVTQNIDHLHTLGGSPPDRTIEVHGRFGLLKCVSTAGCRYATTESAATF